jgi:hypothetical protein
MVTKKLIILLILALIICSCGRKEIKDNAPSETSISTQELLKKFFELKLDTSFSSKSIIVIAESAGVHTDPSLYSRNLKQIFFTDTISFNKLVVDSTLSKSILPIYVKSVKEKETHTLLIFLHNQELCYNISFKEDPKNSLIFLSNNIEYLNFKFRQPFNNKSDLESSYR